MFSRVAKKYDLANSILSLGIHHSWRKKLVKLSKVPPQGKVLDCATGTGDLAIEFKKSMGPTSEVTGCDFCIEMLATAPAKSKQLGLDIKFEQGDVTRLQYPDRQFDVVSIAFGIRNVHDPVLALKEMARVTRPGGKVMVLEFGQLNSPLFSKIFNFYSQKILPKVGGFITGQKEAYEYLQTSSAQFPCREEFLQLMHSSGAFSEAKFHSLNGGIAYIYEGLAHS